MKHKSKDFQCPVGGLMIFAMYDEESKQLSLEEAKGYFYPSCGSVTAGHAFSEDFMTKNTLPFDSFEVAVQHLKDLDCDVQFNS